MISEQYAPHTVAGLLLKRVEIASRIDAVQDVSLTV
jgi:hypothetical protein